jgi:myo-inositol catabolism protein IolC
MTDNHAAKTFQPIMQGAEVLTRPTKFALATGQYVICNPLKLSSLDTAEQMIRDAVAVMGPADGRTIFVQAARQLGDIAMTRSALVSK